ncbi:PilZ domain-containing protein [Alkalilimnicola ehrlichii MLHE-1]|uniref:Type IV pilus assembly PilZ n=1 Tax=Alkalilimnicola ehrlichii (strain ATCC BAA-1101 / DSM 17681 / MLHE-1) TaxID=187272 RepID=Q0ACD4_ALKEH|nr:PilZ domain-containing protein [Alkalilimnicola ehrlichii]ABI55503.1 type IV pilus assembly PilZ [Alkalilimnicola ehrlichii MLHE-1]
MNVEELAEELADFWASALVERDWAGRLELMNRIHEQLYKDLEDERTFRQVSLHFVAAAIHRLGDPPVTSDAQAEIYAQSADEAHCQAARLWWKHGRGGNEAGEAAGEERRRYQRRVVDEPSLVWIGEHTVACRLVDLSAGGARVTAFATDLGVGTQVRVAMPDGEVQPAKVVHANACSAGLRFEPVQRAA